MEGPPRPRAEDEDEVAGRPRASAHRGRRDRGGRRESRRSCSPDGAGDLREYLGELFLVLGELLLPRLNASSALAVSKLETGNGGVDVRLDPGILPLITSGPAWSRPGVPAHRHPDQRLVGEGQGFRARSRAPRLGLVEDLHEIAPLQIGADQFRSRCATSVELCGPPLRAPEIRVVPRPKSEGLRRRSHAVATRGRTARRTLH